MTTSAAAEPLVKLELRAGVATVTLNRPDKRNAMSRAAQNELLAVLASAEDNARVVILTGAGDKSFCAGVDLTEREQSELKPHRPHAWGGHSWFAVQEAILRHPAIFIAAVNGYALGGGLTLVNNCELAIAAEHAQFGMPELGFGIFPALAGPSTIHRILPKHAAEMIFTTRRASAQEALKWGIVNEVVPAELLLSRAQEMAAGIAERDPVLLDYAKKAVRELPRLDWSRAIDLGIQTNAVIHEQAGRG